MNWEKGSFMAGQSFEVEPVAQVIGGRIEPTDDYWGGTRSIIRIDSNRFDADATAGLDAFSHLEVVFRFHLTDPTDLNLGARRPRDNPDWPEVGIFGHRNMRRLNWLAHRHETREPQRTCSMASWPRTVLDPQR
jgi:tRNA (Thr-GGU) A37 N-methylase